MFTYIHLYSVRPQYKQCGDIVQDGMKMHKEGVSYQLFFVALRIIVILSMKCLRQMGSPTTVLQRKRQF